MTPFVLNLVIRPGATFGPYVFITADGNGDVVDLTGWSPFAEFKLTPTSAVALDLVPVLLDSGTIGNFTAATTNLLSLTAHGLIAGQAVQFSSSVTLPAGLEEGTGYFVMWLGLTANDFMVSTDLGGAPVDITDTGTGTHTVYSLPGQVALPEITDNTNHDYVEKSGRWDLMLEDPEERRFAPFGGGTFAIAKGMTNPAE